MARKTDVVDLTLSDDEAPPSSSAKTRPNSQVASNTPKKSSTRYLKPSPSKRNGVNSPRPRNGIIDLSPDPAVSQSSSKPRQTASGAPKAIAKETPHSSGATQNQKPHSRPSPSFRNADKTSPSQNSKPVILSDDDMGGPPVFKTPRGFEPEGSSQQPSAKASLGSPLGATAANPKKRSFDHEKSTDGISPAKKQKLDHPPGRQSPLTSSQNGLAGSPKTRTDNMPQRAKQHTSQKFKPVNAKAHETIDLVSPPRISQKSRASGSSGIERVSSAERQKTPTSTTRVNGSSNRLSQVLEGEIDRSSLNDSVDASQNVSSSQKRRNRSSSPQSTERPHDDGKQIPLPTLTLRALAERDISQKSGLGIDEARSERDPSSRQRKQTAKAKSLGINRPAEAHRDDTSTSSLQGYRLQQQDADEDEGRGKGDAALKERQTRVEPERPTRADSQRESPRRTAASPAKAKMIRIIPSDEDQGYGSLTSGEDERLQGDGTALARRQILANGDQLRGTQTDKLREDREKSMEQLNPSGKQQSPQNGTKKTRSPGVAGEPSSEMPALPGSSSKVERYQQPESEEVQPQNGGASAPVDLGAQKSRKESQISSEEADLQLRTEAMQEMAQGDASEKSENAFALPFSAASAMRSSSIYDNLSLPKRVEMVLGKYLEELRVDNEYWTSVSLQRARLANEEIRSSSFPENSAGSPLNRTSFANLQPVKLSPFLKSASTAENEQLGIEKIGLNAKGQGVYTVSAPHSKFGTNIRDVPNYAHYVSIKNNILAPNVTNLHFWPYFGDEFDMREAENLEEQYNVDIEPRERKLLLLLRSQQYEEYVESALRDLQCTWADVLRFLLEPRPDVGNDLDARKALQNRLEYCQEDFSRTSARAKEVLFLLPPSDPEKLARVAVLCENFQKLAKFSLWHIARRSDWAKPPEKYPETTSAQPSDNEFTCRVCLRFDCPYHGELNEHADSGSDTESGSTTDSVVAMDIVHPEKVNYRTRVALPDSTDALPTPAEGSPLKVDKKSANYWRAPNLYREADERGPFYPCHHPGLPCEDAQCSCFENRLPCEKLCACAPDCKRKFQGCSCSKRGSKGVCFDDERCACFFNGRECDPDLCGGCGVCEVVDPVNKYSDDIVRGRCRNCSIQRGAPKHTLLGDSGVHGLGLYACEDIHQHDFVGEYKGEIITKEEAERRGAVYEHQKLSYLFSLNATQEIDSTYFGNKVRFINHASADKANLYPRIIMVNTVHRIALYAKSTIRAGQELLFDYGPKFPNEQLGGKKPKKSAPHVRNANLVRDFWDVEKSKDELGNVRAKGVPNSTASRSKVEAKKPRGGGGAGAGRKPRRPAEDDETTSAYASNEQDAGERLAAFNISDDFHSDLMDVDDADAGAEDDEYEESDDNLSDGSEESDEGEKSEFDEEEEDEAADAERNARGRRFRRE